jgi:hypothetical protein
VTVRDQEPFRGHVSADRDDAFLVGVFGSWEGELLVE